MKVEGSIVSGLRYNHGQRRGILLILLSIYASQATMKDRRDFCPSALHDDDTIQGLTFRAGRKEATVIDVGRHEKRIVSLSQRRFPLHTASSFHPTSRRKPPANPLNKFCFCQHERWALYDLASCFLAYFTNIHTSHRDKR